MLILGSAGANVWSTSGALMQACTYTPVIAGIALIVMSMILAAILVTRWLKKESQ